MLAEHSGWYTEWRSYRSPACYGWARQPLSGVGSRGRGLGFHTVKCDPQFVRRRMGGYGKPWLRWLDREGFTSAVPLAHFCLQGSAYLQMVVATALIAPQAPTRCGMHGGGVGQRPYAGWGYRSAG